MYICIIYNRSREGGTIRLEALIEPKHMNSSFSSSNFSIRAFQVHPLIYIRQTVPCRAIRGKSSDSRQQYLRQQYTPPPLRSSTCRTTWPRGSSRGCRWSTGLWTCLPTSWWGTTRRTHGEPLV